MYYMICTIWYVLYDIYYMVYTIWYILYGTYQVYTAIALLTRRHRLPLSNFDDAFILLTRDVAA